MFHSFRIAAALTLSALVALAAPPAAALGILVPRIPEASPVRLGPIEVDARIESTLARTRVTQDFVNPNPRVLEADFYFPVPRGANVTDFVLYMDGKPQKGEVLERDEARKIYEDIVRTMKDPGLLEWADYNLFKVRVFPVPANGTAKIELEFAQPLEATQGLYAYQFPLQSARRHQREMRVLPEVKFRVTINSGEHVRNVYSPTHKIELDQADPKSVKVTVPASSFAGTEGQFLLYYELTGDQIAASLLALREAGEDGFFSLILSPPATATDQLNDPYDVVFVIDVSGSMNDGNKIEEARRALAYCVKQLRLQDRFNIVRFSTATQTFREKLVAAEPDIRDAALAYIDALRAGGGTNINQALLDALDLRDTSATTDSERIFTVVFITDGLPTVGVTSVDEILKNARARTSEQVRIFTFGVGYDVNTRLLDQLAEATRAASDYIQPNEDLEVPIGRFFDKLSRPALTNVKLSLEGGGTYDIFPAQIPDLFYGTQLTVFGRYRQAGDLAIKLSATAAGKTLDAAHTRKLPEKETTHRFIGNLWATRKIAFLLDQIREKGENAELKDEVIKLAKQYGIVTPYTSYLVTEDEPVRIGQRPTTRPPTLPRPFQPTRDMFYGQPATAGGRADGAPAEASQLGYDNRTRAAAPASASAFSGFADESGAEAVQAARALRSMRETSVVKAEADALVRSAGGRTFILRDGVWTDEATAPAGLPTVRVRYLSDTWFRLAETDESLKEALALGEQMRIVLNNYILEVSTEAPDPPSDTDLSLLGEKK